MVKAYLLGLAQDGGRPQVGCIQPCCAGLEHSERRYPVALGITDEYGNGHLIDVSRNFPEQVSMWNPKSIQSIWLTHSHFGHVDGLGLFGRETMASQDIDLWASDSMHHLIGQTPMWNIMVEDGVFIQRPFISGQQIELSDDLKITPIEVPHRNELADTHAFLIEGQYQKLLYLPDHDTWEQTLASHGCSTPREWFRNMEVDIVLLDGTFWSSSELRGRSQSEVPHPTVSQSIELLGPRQDADPQVHFIHLNHTNPLYDSDCEASNFVKQMGWSVGKQGAVFQL